LAKVASALQKDCIAQGYSMRAIKLTPRRKTEPREGPYRPDV
jgi:hypothetical protein